ncbi:TPR domain protein [Colletotrichum musicola]|uniref:TPR domain protein n=1 Tax=Colletotrichum musicola TaxID=2175873 RepID=A0A8H6IY28_9PEZI|nr:TPR domain protein [Colletotrichum musicola]
MHNLAFTWKDQERWEDATQLLQDCVHWRENVLGVDHPDTMSSASALSDWELEVLKTGIMCRDFLDPNTLLYR